VACLLVVAACGLAACHSGGQSPAELGHQMGSRANDSGLGARACELLRPGEVAAAFGGPVAPGVARPPYACAFEVGTDPAAPGSGVVELRFPAPNPALTPDLFLQSLEPIVGARTVTSIGQRAYFDPGTGTLGVLAHDVVFTLTSQVLPGPSDLSAKLVQVARHVVARIPR